MRVLPRAESSLTNSKNGAESTNNRNANEFAGFEFGEAISVSIVLKDIVSKGNVDLYGLVPVTCLSLYHLSLESQEAHSADLSPNQDQGEPI